MPVDVRRCPSCHQLAARRSRSRTTGAWLGRRILGLSQTRCTACGWVGFIWKPKFTVKSTVRLVLLLVLAGLIAGVLTSPAAADYLGWISMSSSPKNEETVLPAIP
jgi:hypothetical protein